MKKENDEITDLFRTRLADAGMRYGMAFGKSSRRKFLWLASIVVGFCSSV